MIKFLRFWFPVILYSGIIFYASSIPNVRTPLSEIQFDKFLHVLEYMPFGFLLARGFWNIERQVSKKAILMWVFALSLLYSISDEYHQFLVVGRDADIADLVFSTIGGFIGGYIYLLFSRAGNLK